MTRCDVLKECKSQRDMYRRLSSVRGPAGASQPSRFIATKGFDNQASAGPRTEDNLRYIFSEESIWQTKKLNQVHRDPMNSLRRRCASPRRSSLQRPSL